MTFELSLPPAAFTPSAVTAGDATALGDIIDDNPLLVLPASNTPAARSQAFTLPSAYQGGTITADFAILMASATSGNVKLDLQWRQADDDFERDFDAAQTATIARGSDPNAVQLLSIDFTSAQIDGAVAGSLVQLRLARDNGVGSNAAGDCWVLGCRLFEAA